MRTTQYDCSSIGKEIPLEVDLLHEIDLSDYKQILTSRRFNIVDGKFKMVNMMTLQYESAPFGEMELIYRRTGKHRLQKITIIFSRVMRL